MAYRHGALFVRDVREHCRPIDRNAKARILFIAERLDRATKAKGKRNGQLGYVGLAVLKALLLVFHNSRSGLCCPGYEALERVTGLCRGSVAAGIKRLERAGLLTITRRLVRLVHAGVAITQQGTNLYRINDTAAVAAPLPAKRQRVPRQGMIGSLVAAAIARAESTRQGEPPHSGQAKAKTYVTPAHDWRARARQAMQRG